jgi:hypothetical protein
VRPIRNAFTVVAFEAGVARVCRKKSLAPEKRSEAFELRGGVRGYAAGAFSAATGYTLTL